MLKLDPKIISWSLALHRYPKQPPRVIIFAAMGPGMKLVIDGNFLAKKRKVLFLGPREFLAFKKLHLTWN